MRIPFCQYAFSNSIKIKQIPHNKKALFYRAFLFIIWSIALFSSSLIIRSFCNIFAYNISLLYIRCVTSSPFFPSANFFSVGKLYERILKMCPFFASTQNFFDITRNHLNKQNIYKQFKKLKNPTKK